MTEAYILSAVRTPIGSLQGSLAAKSATELGAIAVRAAVEKSGVAAADVEECLMGNVLTAGEGQSPARQAALFAGLEPHTETLTVGKVCGSGLKAVMLASQAIRLGDADVVVAGGMESMTNAPYLLTKARSGYRYGGGELLDSIVADGLTDVYNKYAMGNAAELCAKECNISREAQDDFSIQSYQRALESQAKGYFKNEIVGVTFDVKGKQTLVSEDDEPKNFRPEKMPTLKSAFIKDGSVTAANASKINDGAAALLLTSKNYVDKHGFKPLAKIIASASAAKKPEYFTTAPIDAIPKVLAKAGLTLSDIDLFEINEAFAVVALAAKNQLGIDNDKLNIRGGAVALGHPIGASGARILVTLVHALQQTGKKRGLAAICIGGGEASAVIVEMM
jgi:acetyl-CoA C-acetyltransferase